MNGSRRACLEAMGIDVYVRRSLDPTPESPGVESPGVESPGVDSQELDSSGPDQTRVDHSGGDAPGGGRAPSAEASNPQTGVGGAPRPGREAALDGIRGILSSPERPAARNRRAAESPPDVGASTPDKASDPQTRAAVVDPRRADGDTPHSEPAQDGPGGADTDGVERMEWIPLRERVSACSQCSELAASRTQTVFGVGNRRARLMVIGEAPGRDEDARGEPFVGRAGQLLDQMLRAMGFAREEVYIANILKCRPPNNRDPSAAEAAACRAYLDRQIALVSPRVILSVGRVSAQNLLHSDRPVGRLRGIVHELQPASIPVVVTYHPAYLLRQPSEKRKAWADLQQAMALLSDPE
ncbi:MAG: uracil-DNA glycosylase [Gammaproteobacteria bacterium]